jgi:hypothetical protein
MFDMATPSDGKKDEPASPQMPFNEALKRVWSAKPMPKTKPKPADGMPVNKPAKPK